MPTAIVTGSGGLIGSESVQHFVAAGYDVVGLENDMRARFFGPSASTSGTTERLLSTLGDSFRSLEIDIRDGEAVQRTFAEHSGSLELVIHTAAQPSHDWAASDPHTDFTVNANGTLNLLEATRRHAPSATFIFCSTNKVYGDRPNHLPLRETDTRLELPEDHRYFAGIDTSMSIDASTHSLFGVSKAAADLLVQEYGRYFGMPTVCFRGGCLTGPNHAGAQLHGFLSYLMRCTMTGEPYTVFGYGGKQVRDNIHSADLVAAFHAFHDSPRPAAVYNIGGGRASNCSMLEAIAACERIAERTLDWSDRGREPHRRSPLVDLRPGAVHPRLPRLADHPRRGLRPARDPRAQCRPLADAAMKLSVVIPAHNEAESIGETVRSTVAELELAQIDHEIVVIDDASSDGTAAVVEALAEHKPTVRCVRSHLPPGFGHAVRAGLDVYTGDAVAIMMADLSDSPKDLVLYYRVLEQGYECAFGTRFGPGGSTHDYPRLKLVLNRIVNAGIRVMFQHGYNDTTNAFKAYRREVIDQLQPLLSNHFNLTVELPLKAIVRGFSYAVVPITWTNRRHGVSKLHLQEMGSRYLFMVLYVWLEHHLSLRRLPPQGRSGASPRLPDTASCAESAPPPRSGPHPTAGCRAGRRHGALPAR